MLSSVARCRGDPAALARADETAPPHTHCLHAAVPGLAAARSPGVSVSSASLWSAKNNSAKCNLKKAMFIIFPKLYMTNVGERERGGGRGRERARGQKTGRRKPGRPILPPEGARPSALGRASFRRFHSGRFPVHVRERPRRPRVLRCFACFPVRQRERPPTAVLVPVSLTPP